VSRIFWKNCPLFLPPPCPLHMRCSEAGLGLKMSSMASIIIWRANQYRKDMFVYLWTVMWRDLVSVLDVKWNGVIYCPPSVPVLWNMFCSFQVDKYESNIKLYKSSHFRFLSLTCVWSPRNFFTEFCIECYMTNHEGHGNRSVVLFISDQAPHRAWMYVYIFATTDCLSFL